MTTPPTDEQLAIMQKALGFGDGPFHQLPDYARFDIRPAAQALADHVAAIHVRYEKVAEDINAMPAGDHLSDVAVVGWQLAAMYAAAMVREVSK